MIYLKVFLSNPLDKLELTRKVKLSKIVIQILDGCVMFAFHHDIPVDDLTALAVNYIDLGDKTVNSFILNHTNNIAYEPRKVKKNFQLFFCMILLPEVLAIQSFTKKRQGRFFAKPWCPMT